MSNAFAADIAVDAPTSSICTSACPRAADCPFRRYERECPDVVDLEADCNRAGISLWQVLLRRPA